MKNKDFDFIKGKFDSAQPAIPEGLSKKQLRQKIESQEEHKIIKFNTNKSINFKAIATAAACFMLICGVAFADSSKLADGSKISGFKSYDELNSVTANLEQISSGESGCAESLARFYKEEIGVESPDVIKANGNYIYYAYHNSTSQNGRNKVYIFEADKQNTKLVSTINDIVPEDAEIYGIFVTDTRLVINASTDSDSLIKIYNINDKINPILISEFRQSGKYANSRMINNSLYVVSDYSFAPNNTSAVPSISENNSSSLASSKNIVSFENVKLSQYAVISTIDILSGKQSADLKAVLGGNANINCSKDYMFICEYSNNESSADNAIKLNLKSGKFSKATSSEIDEYISNPARFENDSISRSIYAIGNYWLSIEENLNSAESTLVLYNKSMEKLDSIALKDTTVISKLAINNNTFALPACFADASRRYYGSIVFKIESDCINIISEYKNDDDNLMYQGYCIIQNDYLYSFDINDNQSDTKKLKVFAYKYQ